MWPTRKLGFKSAISSYLPKFQILTVQLNLKSFEEVGSIRPKTSNNLNLPNIIPASVRPTTVASSAKSRISQDRVYFPAKIFDCFRRIIWRRLNPIQVIYPRPATTFVGGLTLKISAPDLEKSETRPESGPCPCCGEIVAQNEASNKDDLVIILPDGEIEIANVSDLISPVEPE